MSVAPDPELEAFFSDVTAAIEDDLQADGGCPDLAAVVALAHRLDPTAVPQVAVDEVSAWAPVVTLREGRRRRATRDDPELVAFLSDVRAQVEQEVVDRFAIAPRPADPLPMASVGDRSPVPHAPVQSVARPQTGAEVVSIAPRRVWAGVLAAAAALMLIAGGVVTGVLVSRDDAPPLPQSAVHQDPPAESAPSTIRETNEPRPRRAVLEPDPESALPHEDAIAPEAAPDPEPALEVDPEPAPAPKRSTARRGKSAPAPDVAPTLEELDERAHEAWRAGDLARAEAAFREIVARGGRSGRGGRLADLAYGDLFTLARQSKKPAREAALWREYVAAFPKGRFADDARAGLCRRADGDDRRACWAAYLDAMPEGSHRAQAQRELGEK